MLSARTNSAVRSRGDGVLIILIISRLRSYQNSLGFNSSIRIDGDDRIGGDDLINDCTLPARSRLSTPDHTGGKVDAGKEAAPPEAAANNSTN
jgi:hypothetical protein